MPTDRTTLQRAAGTGHEGIDRDGTDGTAVAARDDSVSEAYGRTALGLSRGAARLRHLHR